MANKKNILVTYNYNKDKDLSLCRELLEVLKEKNCDVYTVDQLIGETFNIDVIADELFYNLDLVIILGGDGTILDFVRKYGKYSVPIFAINLGRVGALAIASINNYKELLDRYFNNDYFVTNNLTLKCKIRFSDGREDINQNIYNEIVLHRGMSFKMLPIDIAINSTKFDKIYADGVLVATPSGSSAYNFSAGGPLLSHDSNCYVITPICPQTRDFVPLVVSKDDTVRLFINDIDDKFSVSIDGGELITIKRNDLIYVYKSDHYLRLINFNKQKSIYETVYKVMSSNTKN